MPSKSDSKWPGWKKARKLALIWMVAWLCSFDWIKQIGQQVFPHFFHYIYNTSYNSVCDTAEKINYSGVVELHFFFALKINMVMWYYWQRAPPFKLTDTNGKTSLLHSPQQITVKPHLRRSTLRSLCWFPVVKNILGAFQSQLSFHWRVRRVLLPAQSPRLFLSIRLTDQVALISTPASLCWGGEGAKN